MPSDQGRTASPDIPIGRHKDVPLSPAFAEARQRDREAITDMRAARGQSSELIAVKVTQSAPCWWAVECDRHGLVVREASVRLAEAAADKHRHCPCPEVGGDEVGDYIVDLCHERGVHDGDVIWPLVNAAREDALGLCEQIVDEALGVQP